MKLLAKAILGALLILLAGTAPYAYPGGGVDKCGLTPQVLKLPSGPGSITGLGESFTPQLNSGIATYRVPLTVPPGRTGFSPEIALVYNAGKGNGPLGIGWKMAVPFIQRRTDKGLPIYDDTKDQFVTGSGDRLVYIGNGFYRCEIESEFDLYERTGTAWKVSHKDGTQSDFGRTESERLQNNDHIFRWAICKRRDANGNEIVYHYNETNAFPDAVQPADKQLYLTSIHYNVGSEASQEMRIELYYELRSIHDRLFDYRSRFPVQTTQRCSEIIMYAGQQRVRSYRLEYENSLAGLSLLSRVAMYGKDPNQGPLPAVLSFAYTRFALNSQITAMDNGFEPHVGLELADVDLADMNGDALPDLLYTGGAHQVFINSNGTSWQPPYTIPGGFAEITLSHENTMLMDMDGDGASDLFSQDVSINGYRYFSGRQTNGGWAFYPVEMDNSPDFTFSQTTKPVDLDHDGCTDVIHKSPLSNQIACVFNQNGQSFSSFFSINAPSTSALFNFGPEAMSGLRLADMNGDGLQDFVILKNEGEIWYYAGHGVTLDPATPGSYQGWDEIARGQWSPGDPGAEGYAMADVPTSQEMAAYVDNFDLRKIHLLDINGDGLTDLVFVSNNALFTWLNLGGHAFSSEPFAIVSASIHSQSAQTRIRTVDMNANGTMDVVWNRLSGFEEMDHAGTSWVYLDLTAGVKPNLLRRIDNGIGRVTQISYKSAIQDLVTDRAEGREWIYRLPHAVNVVARVDESDGRGTVHTQTVTYHDGYYDGLEKEFRGFAHAESRTMGDSSVPDLITAYTYDTGAVEKARRGKPLMLAVKTDADEVFYQEQYTWATRILAEGAADEVRNVKFAFQASKIRNIREKGIGTPVQLKWEDEYDDYGNVVRHIEHGRMDEEWDDERVTETVYSAAFDSNADLWILDKIITSTVLDEKSNRVSQTRNYYDGNTTLGLLTKGNLTQVEKWVKDATYITTERNKYDSHGNIIAAYDALYGKHPGHYREYIYDEHYYTFPVREIIHTGTSDLSVSAQYDAGWGVIQTSTDFNGHTTTYAYDTFGRLTSITKPPDTVPTIVYDYMFGYHLPDDSIINWVQTRHSDGSADGYLSSRAFYDGLGRKIMTRHEDETHGQVVVKEAVRYNARKKLWKKYQPYFDTGTLDYAAPGANAAYTEHIYDAQGREIRTYQPGGWLYSQTTYAPLEQTVQDENQTDTTSSHAACALRLVHDGLLDKAGNGRLRQVYNIVKIDDAGDPLSSPVSWQTTYRFDLNNNLTGHTDAQNNSKYIYYDGIGRMIYMNDPDRGRVRFAYDDTGNVIERIDAKGQIIQYEYDGANRLTAEYYGAGHTTPDVVYHYDEPAGPVDRGRFWHPDHSGTIAQMILQNDGIKNPLTYDLNQDGRLDVADVVKASQNAAQPDWITADNVLGRLSWVTDLSGEEHNAYDERGRVKWVVKRIIDTGQGSLRNFYTQVEYDAMDRVTRRTFPDQSFVDYLYNDRGLLESIPNVIDAYDYTAAGQSSAIAKTCGTLTTIVYDARLRLSRLQTVRTADSVTLQDLIYTYDQASNITAITDNRASTQLDAIGVELGLPSTEARQFNATRSFVYDSLYRLTRASNSSVYGTQTYRYDRIGNMLRKSATLITPDPLMDPGLMSHGGSAGAYNRSGRIAGDPPGPHAITATEKGPQGAQQFTYDDNGNIIFRRGVRHAWNYKDQLINVTNGHLSAEYLYDYTGLRRKKRIIDANDRAEASVFYIDKHTELRDSRLIKYIYAKNNRIVRCETSPVLATSVKPSVFYIHDHLGSTAISLTDDGTVVEQAAYYPFGRQRITAKADDAKQLAPYSFTGKELDFESDLHYFGARHYDGSLGNFISVDPLSLETKRKGEDAGNIKEANFGWLRESQELNYYAYVSRNPLKYIDLLGLTKKAQWKKSTKFYKYEYSTHTTSDPDALKLANRIGGEPSVIFKNLFKGKEFDAVSDQFLGDAKPANFKLGSKFRNSAKEVFKAAKELNKKPYFHFEGKPQPDVISKLIEYGIRYNLMPVIDSVPFAP